MNILTKSDFYDIEFSFDYQDFTNCNHDNLSKYICLYCYVISCKDCDKKSCTC